MGKITFKNYLGQGTLTTMCSASASLSTGTLVTIDASNAITPITSGSVANVYLVAEPIAASSEPAKCVAYPVIQRDTLDGFLVTAKITGEKEDVIGSKLVVADNEFVKDASGTMFYISDVDTSKVYPVAYESSDAKTYVTLTVVSGGDALSAGTRFDLDEDGKVAANASQGIYKAVTAYVSSATSIQTAKYLQGVNAKVLV